MPRPGFVLDVDRTTPPILYWRGENLTLEKLPPGSRVVYGPEPVPALPDPDAAVRHAIENPLGEEPLRSLLRPGMKLTVAFDDVSQPLPPMRGPDNRQRVIEAVLDLAAEAGVDDVELIAAIGLHRRMHSHELRHALGDRVFESFMPIGRLKQHDAEDPDNLLEIGATDHGEVVYLNRRVATSDLVVYVSVNLLSMNGGHKNTAIGLAGYRTINCHRALRAVDQGDSSMDGPARQDGDASRRIGKIIGENVRIFQIETTLNTEMFPKPFAFLQRREWEWSMRDRGTYMATKASSDVSPGALTRRLLNSTWSPHAMTGVFAGEVETVHAAVIASVREHQVTPVEGQTDILTFGIPYVSPYAVNSIMNPILVACSSLAHFFNMYIGKPLVREGGVVIIHHPTPWEFHPVHHPSYIDFFEQVLADSLDPAVIEQKYEQRFATDPWYVHLYRSGHAYHGAHPLHVWYRCAQSLAYLGGVIIVGGNTAAVRRLGLKSASTFQDALEMAGDITGNRNPTLTHFHCPPALAEVT